MHHVNKFFVLLAISLVLIFSYVEVSAQDPQLATFQETAQIIIDKSLSNNVTAAIALQSTSNQEIRIPVELSNKIQDTERVIAVIITSEEQCVLGVQNESCVMINLSREGIEGGIFAIQDTGRRIGDSLIDDINSAFDTDAQFHSVFIHQADETGVALETSGVISGRGTVSAVYTMPREDSKTMYEKFSTILLPKEIRESGGFYDIAKKISEEQDARITLSIIPQNGMSLYQLKLSIDYPNTADKIGKINPLELLQIKELKRSNYFTDGFYPLNSLLQVVILSKEPEEVSRINGKILPTQVVEDEKIPIDLTTSGWIFDPDSGQKIDGKYLFGKEFSVSENELIFSLSSYEESLPGEISTQIDDAFIIIPIIVVVAAGAIIYFLKGFKKSS